MDLIYFEPQVGKMCAQHALNMLLQGHYFTGESLITIARELDSKERAVLNPQEESRFSSQNFDETGYFSIQVIIEALRRQASASLIPLDSPTVIKIRDNLSLAKAYICNMDDHWFTIRKIGGAWFILNSLYKSPRIVSHFHMEEYITQLYKQGYSVYVVEGDLPSCAADSLPHDFWIDRAGNKKFESDIEKAIALSLKESGHHNFAIQHDDFPSVSTSVQMPAETFDVQRALEESLKEVQSTFDADTVEALQLNEAIQKSLFEAATSSSFLPNETSSKNLKDDKSTSKSIETETSSKVLKDEKPPPN